MRKYLFVSLAVLFACLSCGNRQKVDCERLPEDLLRAYMPYTLGETVQFAAEGDTMTFVVDDVVIPDSYDYIQYPAADCIFECAAATVTLTSSYADGVTLYYKVVPYDGRAYIDFRVSGSAYRQALDLALGMQSYGSDWQSLIAPALTLNGTSVYYRADIAGQQGISAIYERGTTAMDEGRVWRLVEAPTVNHRVVYDATVKKIGC